MQFTKRHTQRWRTRPTSILLHKPPFIITCASSSFSKLTPSCESRPKQRTHAWVKRKNRAMSAIGSRLWLGFWSPGVES
ncbi:hypothetical protein VIGAN_11091000 [Vigna angularis var. angularis]|uniref:Uncharacterized protein n=1 Tax=Vigna angularis var. angularis TaxID=157739 RepID=A0A0S3T9G0_PHAAN|nr:hypothetical protein VIGAN_11091000 [Vigna angularis var. angularis]